MAVKDDYQEFKNALNDLKLNSKPIINFLTILAEEKSQNAQQIVRAIEERILEAKGDYVLPVLYVLDSIVKNLRSSTYTQLFENKLPVIFASAFNKVDERTRSSMFKLRQTWPPYFTNTTLYNLDTRTHYIDPAWPITARVPDASPSTPNIHFNPDFIQRNPTSTNQQKLPIKQDNNDRNVNQVPVKNSDASTKDDNYHMIPIDRKDQNRQETEAILNKNNNNVKQQPKTTKKDVPVVVKPEVSTEEINNEKTNTKTPEHDEEVLFGGSDIDYRDTDITTQSKPPPATTTTTNLDTDRLVKLNSECLLLAEEKFKSKELSSDEYQATLKLLQNILQNEVQRLTVPSTTTPSLLNNTNPSTVTTLANNPFQSQPSLGFPLPSAAAAAAPTIPSFPFTGFGNDTQRHALQILAAVGASTSYATPNNFFPYLPPLPPAPPPFPLVPNTFPSQVSSTAPGRLSPSIKRPIDENSNNNLHSDEDLKRARFDPPIPRSHNFDEENIAPVPSLLDANINTLKKKYIGVIQQLYIGKYQCRLCGLRFSAKQKHLYAHHLDWHYWQNRQATTSTALLDRCRDWYPSLQEWTIHEENLDEQIRQSQMMVTQNRQTKGYDKKLFLTSEVVSCPAEGNGDMDDDRCYVCHDPFENFFDDNKEEWCLKDAVRVDGKTYHPICYQDVQYQETNEKISELSNNVPSTLNENLTDDASNQSSESQLVDTAMATVNIKSEIDESMDKTVASDDEEDTTKPKYLSSMSFVNLVESIFVKKEDLKPIENIQPVPINVKEELMDSTTNSQDIPFLSIKPENECEFLIKENSDGFRTISDS